MKSLLIIVGAIVVLGVVVQLVGMMLPRTHTASCSARLKQKPEVIFATITNWREFPNWRADLKSVRERQGAEGRTSWIEVSKMGEMPLEIIELDPPRKMVGLIADPEHKLPFGGMWTHVIEPDGAGGCTVTITEDGEVRPAVFRFMAKFIFGYTGTMEAYLKSLRRKFGEEPDIQR